MSIRCLRALYAGVGEAMGIVGLLIRDPLLPSEIMPQHPRRALVRSVLRYQDEARRLWRDFLMEANSE